MGPSTGTAWTFRATLEGASHKAHSDTPELIQRYNAVAVLGTFAHTTPEDEM